MNFSIIPSRLACKMFSNYAVLNWYKRLRDGNKNKKLLSSVHVLQTTAKQIISRQAQPGGGVSRIPIYPIPSP